MRASTRAATFAVALIPILAACGGDDDTATPNDSGDISITMNDNRFEPENIEVEAGQTVRFRFSNDGEVEHEAFIGSAEEQQAHEEEMRAATESDGQSTDEPHGSSASTEHMSEVQAVLTVPAGETQTLEYTFDQPDTLILGCHEPGHYATMRAEITVQ